MKDDAATKILILTLHCGEREFDACCRSVEEQRHVDYEHRVFANLSKAEAHMRLYETIMAQAHDFDLFVKLDADMVLADDAALERVVTIFRDVPGLDHLVLGVADWFTDTDIIGLHTFSPRVRWLPNPSGLFTDPDPVFPGRKLMIRHPTVPVVKHGPDPSPFQAFYFGVHRATKACQRALPWKEKQPFSARTNWQTIVRVWSHSRRCRDRRLDLALWGADLVLRGELPDTAVNRQDPALIEAFRHAENLSSDELETRLTPRWSRWSVRQLAWFRGMGLTMTLLVGLRSLRDLAAFAFRSFSRDHRKRPARDVKGDSS